MPTWWVFGPLWSALVQLFFLLLDCLSKQSLGVNLCKRRARREGIPQHRKARDIKNVKSREEIRKWSLGQKEAEERRFQSIHIDAELTSQVEFIGRAEARLPTGTHRTYKAKYNAGCHPGRWINKKLCDTRKHCEKTKGEYILNGL